MRLFRGILAIVFFGFIIFGLRKRWATDHNVSEKDMFVPVRNSIADRFSSPTMPRTYNALTSGSLNTNTSTIPSVPTQNTQIINDQNTVLSEIHPDITFGGISPNDIDYILNDTVIHGNNNADFVMMIYCDYDATYCKQFHEEGLIDVYQRLLDDNLSYTYVGFPFSMNSSTLTKHRTYMCAQRVASSDILLSLQDDLYTKEFTDPIIPGYEQRIGKTGLGECSADQTGNQIIKEQRTHAKKLFNITALPTFVMINLDTNEWMKIPGLYTNEEIFYSLEYFYNQ